MPPSYLDGLKYLLSAQLSEILPKFPSPYTYSSVLYSAICLHPIYPHGVSVLSTFSKCLNCVAELKLLKYSSICWFSNVVYSLSSILNVAGSWNALNKPEQFHIWIISTDNHFSATGTLLHKCRFHLCSPHFFQLPYKLFKQLTLTNCYNIN